jgi:4'-phosphopantetheinyl transferase
LGVRIPPGAPHPPLPITRFGPRALTPDDRGPALDSLSGAERARFEDLVPARADAFLAGRALLRQVAGELLGIEPVAVPLVARCPECGREHGRPILAGTDLRVSLAHASSSVAVAASWGAAVGIDLEPLAGRVERLDAIEALTGVRSLRHWTRLEAVLKADGRGLRVDPGAVRVTEVADGITAAIAGGSARYRLIDEPADGMIVTVAVAL